MPSLTAKGMESSSGEQTLPPVKYRSNSTPDVEQNKDVAYKGPELCPSGSGKVTTPVSSVVSKEAHSSASDVDTFNIKDAIYSYAVSCRDDTGSSEDLKQHIVKWVEHIHRQNGRGAADSFVDFSACVHCQCLPDDPVTITCGHTYCKMCLGKLSLKTCVKCGHDRHHSNWVDFKTNVVIAEVMSKWWPEELKVVRLKADGSKLFLENQIDKAIEKYTQAFNVVPNSDHLLASNLSHAHLQMGQAVLALQYAETTIKLRPDWPKGYFRKGFALLSLGRYEDAAVALLQCLALEPQLPSVITELTKVIHQRIFKLCKINKPYPPQSLRRGSEVRQPMSVSAFAAHIFKRRVFGSRDSTDDKSSDEEDDASVGDTGSKRKRRSSLQVPLVGFERLCQFLDRCQISVDILKKIEPKTIERTVDPSLLDKNDFECTLCLRTFWQPVTTPCGHVFCRVCLDRCLDHTPRCPLCKSSLEDYLAERRQFVTEFIEVAIQTHIPEAHAERRQSHLEEMNELTKNAEGNNREMPIFVCTLAFPTVLCPLHIFEPRYRLMIRRCLESGSRMFGMCAPQEGAHDDTFSDYGTTLEIRDVQYFPDGRAVVDAVGRKRFRVLERNMKDGYHTATIEFLEDQPGDENETGQLHDAVHSEVLQWFGRLNPQIKNQILGHFGPMPDAETDFNRSANGPAWVWWTVAILPLDARAQLAILSMTSLQKRLEALHRTLSYMLKGHS